MSLASGLRTRNDAWRVDGASRGTAADIHPDRSVWDDLWEGWNLVQIKASKYSDSCYCLHNRAQEKVVALGAKENGRWRQI